MEIMKLTEWKISANVAVKNEEAFGISSSDLITEVVEATSSSKLHKLLQVTDEHDLVLALHFVEEGFHFRVLIGAYDENFLKIRHLAASLDMMLDNGHSRDWEKWLRNIQR